MSKDKQNKVYVDAFWGSGYRVEGVEDIGANRSRCNVCRQMVPLESVLLVRVSHNANMSSCGWRRVCRVCVSVIALAAEAVKL